MAQKKPSVYVLFGDDEFSLSNTLALLGERLGESGDRDLNTIRYDGSNLSPVSLPVEIYTVPFLAERRLAVIGNFDACLEKIQKPSTDEINRKKPGGKRPAGKDWVYISGEKDIPGGDAEKLIKQLEAVPPSTALVLVSNGVYTPWKIKNTGRMHWFEIWARNAGDHVFVREFPRLKGRELEAWVNKRTEHHGGRISPDAVRKLIEFTGDENRLIDQEIQKLLAYVNYSRTVEYEDVIELTPDVGEGEIFAFVDAIGGRNIKEAVNILKRLSRTTEHRDIFRMVVRQFRLLVMTKEIMINNGREAEVSRQCRVPTFVAKKIMLQSGRFDLPSLEKIYRELLEIENSVWDFELTYDLALDTLVAVLAQPTI